MAVCPNVEYNSSPGVQVRREILIWDESCVNVGM
jgi:hypothetical protein